MSHALNGSSTLELFERSTTIEICNGIMFNFYPGLPHIFFKPFKLKGSANEEKTHKQGVTQVSAPHVKVGLQKMKTLEDTLLWIHQEK